MTAQEKEAARKARLTIAGEKVIDLLHDELPTPCERLECLFLLFTSLLRSIQDEKARRN
jgi:hypothetical protein